jgi:hypothetical protein
MPDRLGTRTEISPLKSSSSPAEKKGNQTIAVRVNTGMIESEDQKAHLHLDRHFIGHLTLGLYVQLGDHGNHIAHLGQGRLDPRGLER